METGMGRTFLATVLVLASLTGNAAAACRDQVSDLKAKIAAETDPAKRGAAAKQINAIDTMSEVDCGNAVVRAWRELQKPSQQSIAEQQRLKAATTARNTPGNVYQNEHFNQFGNPTMGR
jgi:hypothetical protein